MIDEKYIQRPPGGPLKAGSFTYDRSGKLIAVDGIPVPEDLEVYSQEVIDSLPPEEEKEDEE